MPAWLVAAFIKYGVPLIISILQKTGAVNAAETFALKFATKTVEDLGNLKTYHEDSDFPSGR